MAALSVRNRIRAWFVPACIGALAVSGCSSEQRTVLDFAAPRILLHVEADPADIANSLTADGVSVSTRERLGSANGDVVVTGTDGTVQWNGSEVRVQADRLDVNGTPVESRPEGYRNVTLTRDGQVLIDVSLPWEW